MRIVRVVLVALLGGSAFPQGKFFAGALTGVATLSADAQFEVPVRAAASGYKPENGIAFSQFAGLHTGEHISLQASYIRHRNNVRYHALSDGSFYDQRARTSHHLWIADVMLYFRGRSSWARPYLAVGTGVAYVSSDAAQPEGTTTDPPGSFSEFSPVLNVAVGIDLRIRGWAFRYTFGETIQRNSFSTRLTPPGQRNLAGFRNFFGFLKQF